MVTLYVAGLTMSTMASGAMQEPPAAYEGAYEGYGGRPPAQFGNPQAAQKKPTPKRDFLDGKVAGKAVLVSW